MYVSQEFSLFIDQFKNVDDLRNVQVFIKAIQKKNEE